MTLTLVKLEGGNAAKTIMDDEAEHKEIQMSTTYLYNFALRGQVTDEIRGLLVHEMTHCYQFNGRGSCSRGLVTGIAGEFMCALILYVSVMPSLQTSSDFVRGWLLHIGGKVDFAGIRDTKRLDISWTGLTVNMERVR